MCNLPKKAGWMLFISIALVCTMENQVQASQDEISINGIVIDVRGKEPVVPDLLEARTEKGLRTWIVQFDGPIHGADKERVISSGCRLLDYLPEFAFLAVMDNPTKKKVEKLPFVRGIVRFKPAYKLHGALREKAIAPAEGEPVRLHLKLDDAGHLHDVISVVHRLKGEVLNAGGDTLRVAVRSKAIADLAALEEVVWLDEHYELQLFNDTAAWVVQGNQPGSYPLWGRGLHGEGEIVAIGDTGIDYDMPWFRDAAGAPPGPGHRKLAGYDTTWGDDYDADSPGHGTHVAGTLAGDRTPVDGQTNANGMAPKARLFLQDLTPGSGNYVNVPDDLGLLFVTAYNAGARLHSNSWGNSSNSYGPYAASTDRFLWEHRDFLALFAAGNAGPGGYSVGNPATAKNAVSVGATLNGTAAASMAGFSSNGPSSDGRIKPTVTAPGYDLVSADADGVKGSLNSGTLAMSGTSMATPVVAGVAAMVRQYFSNGFYPRGSASPGSSFSPSAALVKAALINSAENMGGSGTGGPIPSSGQGWGRVNLNSTFATDGRGLVVVDEGAGLETGGSWSHPYLVGSGAPFKVSLVWTDYPGATGAAKALVNDLDLTVTAPDGTVYYGNTFSGGVSVSGGTPDRVNVEEQLLLPALAGRYEVTVSGYNTPFGPQPFALAISGAADVTAAGMLVLDRRRYNSAAVVRVQLADSDLNGDSGAIEQFTLLASSASEPDGESVILIETAANSAIFTGTLPLAGGMTVPGDGRLQVGNGETLAMIYHDLNCGNGQEATVLAEALVDNEPPQLSPLTVDAVSDVTASLSWSSDEAADATLAYYEAGYAEQSKSDRRLSKVHAMVLAGLHEGATYSAIASGLDEAGNSGSGAVITFATLMLPPSLTAGAAAGATTYQASTLVFGISTDPSGIDRVTVNGSAASYRSSDGYYNASVPLQFGGNVVSVVATDLLGNQALTSLVVTRLQPGDLYLQALTGPTAARQGEPLTAGDTVCNNGPGDTPAAAVGFYLSRDQLVSADDTFIGKRDTTALAAGACSSGTSSHVMQPLAPGGTFYLLALADYAGILTETSRANNSFAGPQLTLPYLPLAVPAALTVPPTSTSGSFIVYFGSSSVYGVSYILEMSKDGGAYNVVYSGNSAGTAINVAASGNYAFRLKATKDGYLDSGFTPAANCAVALALTAPSDLAVPPTSASGSFSVYFGTCNTTGVTYILEMSKDGGAFALVYSGTSSVVNIAAASSGVYSFRVKASKTGYSDSGYTAGKSCVVTLTCATPASLGVPAANTSGSFQVIFGSSNVYGVTYLLEQSRDGGAFAPVYSGTSSVVNIAAASSGVYSFRVKASKTGYSDSGYTAGKSCVVTLTCATPASLGVPAANTSGSFQVIFGSSNVYGVTYLLEQSRDGGAFVPVYSGTSSVVNIAAASSGVYSFRVKASKTGYSDSGYTAGKSCVVTLTCATPASLGVPAANTSGSFQVIFGSSNVYGVTYLLEQSRDGGAFVPVYSGTGSVVNIAAASSGVYSFRVKATKAGYADSGWRVSGSVLVILP